MMNKSIFLAIAISLLLAAWIMSGSLLSGNDETTAASEVRRAPEEDTAFAVLVEQNTALDFTRSLTIRGRTEAIRSVELKAEVDGQVIATPAEKGERVQKGALICHLAPNERKANLDEARALMDQRRLEYDAALELAEKGHRSATQVAQAKALYEAAQARMQMMQVAFDNTAIRAPFSGLIDDRPAEIGDFLQKGNVCARILQEDPFLVVGEVSEHDVNSLIPGSEAVIAIAPDFKRTGHVRFISSTAAERTRTFRVEVVLANKDHVLKDGMTANIEVPVETVRAHRLSPATLVLNTEGRLGVRTVQPDDHVGFHPVTIIDEDENGLWVRGLPETVRIIVTGQEFVTIGQRVRATTGQEVAQ